ncbi:MAG: serine/threonine protein kinase [Actinobacteria bacterium]|nr:serine/threonine protein kinase [Actinomycetota bacterium]
MPSAEQPTTQISSAATGEVVLGRYELIEPIGRGGFSTVYRAYDRKLGRQVAVKAIRRLDGLPERAAHEARAAAKLSHPHIVTVFEYAEDDSSIYLVSELVEGATLTEALATRTISVRGAAMIILQVLEALTHAHERGVVHRDIKPDNIMLAGGPEPAAKVMDFGIAQLENTQRLTRQGDIIGTLAYMSPEQADGRLVDGATDVYSTALTLYECLTGSNPFKAGGAAATISRINAGAPPLNARRPDLPSELSRLVEEAMDPDPEFRLGLSSFAAGLEEILAEMGGQAQLTTVLRRSDRPRVTLIDDLRDHFGWLGPRIASAGLAALIAWPSIYESSYYPAVWRLPLAAGVALLVALLPRIGIAALGVAALLPLVAFSAALGAIAAAAVAGYYLTFGLVWPRVALLPALAAGLGVLGIGLAFPAIAGAVGHVRRGLILALTGGIIFTAWQLVKSPPAIDYLGFTGAFGLTAKLAGNYNPVSVLKELVTPLRAHPVLLTQPGIWLVASLPAALLVRRRYLIADAAGIILSGGFLAAGYLALPLVFAGFRLPETVFMKTLGVCVIIQIVLLLLSPRNRLQNPSPHERT